MQSVPQLITLLMHFIAALCIPVNDCVCVRACVRACVRVFTCVHLPSIGEGATCLLFNPNWVLGFYLQTGHHCDL